MNFTLELHQKKGPSLLNERQKLFLPVQILFHSSSLILELDMISVPFLWIMNKPIAKILFLDLIHATCAKLQQRRKVNLKIMKIPTTKK